MEKVYLDKHIIEVETLFNKYKYVKRIFKDGFNLTLTSNIDGPNLSVFFTYNDSLQSYCYYVGVDNMKAQQIWVDDNLFGFDYFKTYEELRDALPTILDDSYFLVARALSYMPPVIIRKKDFNKISKFLKQMINVTGEYDLYNYSTYGEWLIYTANGEYFKEIFPTKIRLSLAPRISKPLLEACLGYFDGDDVYNAKPIMKTAYFSYTKDKLILKETSSNKILKTILKEEQGAFILGDVNGKVYTQLFDINGKLLITFCNIDNIDKNDPDYEHLAFGTRYFFDLLSSYASENLLYYPKYQAYVTQNYFNKIIGKE